MKRIALLLVLASAAEAQASGTLTLSSSAFAPDGTIPSKYTCEGTDTRSPPLKWSGVPASAKSLALIVDDPDAPDDSAANCFLVSSSMRLADLETKFGDAPGESRILSVSSTVAVLSIVPGVTIGMTAMRAFLFDGSLSRGTSELEMALRRVVRESEEVSMPFARRSALKRAVTSRIVQYARANSSSKEERHDLEREIQEDIIYGRNSERAASILSAALDDISADRRVERQLADAHKEIEKLKAQLLQQRRRS